jgi:hypothetical protein
MRERERGRSEIDSERGMEGEREWEKMGRRVRDGGREMGRDSERDIFG